MSEKDMMNTVCYIFYLAYFIVDSKIKYMPQNHHWR